ncbi:enoyl-CoA hydratase/isomerase family protein [Polynucleobacter necessarius]|uniref:enoyl-CoA hydratase/isomerase family protein n=1 Tax=Polynucleobacter necessarius TaxID=576610 RepID=UPI001E45CA7A|nr:enoyl-CoA hydratase/isomerase family protein [Polynucleobacter necessarius]
MTTRSTPPCLDLTLEGAIARITFNNPAARNAMTWPMYEELKSICDALAKNDSVRVAIFRGAGDKAFVSGSDIEQFVNLQKDEAYEVAVDDIFHSLHTYPYPLLL